MSAYIKRSSERVPVVVCKSVSLYRLFQFDFINILFCTASIATQNSPTTSLGSSLQRHQLKQWLQERFSLRALAVS
jgi:hypothetical protein